MNDPYSGWAIVEIMGHRKFGAFVTEQDVAGARLLRCDIPATGDQPAYSQFYGGAAIFCLTPTTEELARAVAVRATAPVSIWELPQPRPAIPAPGYGGIRDQDNDDDDPDPYDDNDADDEPQF